MTVCSTLGLAGEMLISAASAPGSSKVIIIDSILLIFIRMVVS